MFETLIVNISCFVSDDVDVAEVCVNITYPGGSFSNESMVSAEGGLYYNESYYVELGLYDFFIWANDSSGNSNVSLGHSFVIEDVLVPVISDVVAQPDVQGTGGFVNISCFVSDDVVVDVVVSGANRISSSMTILSIAGPPCP